MSKRESLLYEFGPFRLDPSERLLLRAGEPVPLTPKAFETLIALVKRAGHLADKEELLKELWPDSFVEESNLAQNIHALRRALGEGENGKPYIETVPKRGYRFLAAVRVVEAAAPVEEIPAAGNGHDAALKSRAVEEAAAWEKPEALEPSAPFVEARREGAGAKGAVLILVSVAVALGLAGLLYWWTRRAAPPSHFQTMKLTRLTTSGKVFNAAISPDGKHVVYATFEGGRQSLWVRQTATQGQVQIIEPAEVVYTGLTFSPDSNHIYYGILSRDFPNRALFRIQTLGGGTTKVLENLRANPVSFSPDGRQFCFVRYTPGRESALMVAKADGSGERKLLARDASGTIRFAAWSPDGKRIAYEAQDYESNDSTVFEAQVADGAARPLTARRWLRIGGLSWLADGGGLLMLATAEDDFSFQVWQLSYPQGEARRLTNDLNTYELMSLTADSETLAVVDVKTEMNVWVAPLEDLGRARPVTSGRGVVENCLTWTPDGRILYHSNASGTDDIWIVNPDGGEQKQLTSGARINQCPAVSPDGSHIVFLSDRTGTPHLWRMNLDGSDQRQLTDGAGGEQNPHFSPDGRWLVYRTTLGRATAHRMPAGGGEPVPLTDKVSYAPAVSPDSRLVAYTFQDDDARMRLAVAPLEGGTPLRTFDLPRPLAFARFLRWTPDGSAVAYIEEREGVSNIVAQPIDGGPKRHLTDFKEGQFFSFAFSPDGRQLALSRGAISRDVVLVKDFR